jgi:hypothetical protein
MESELIPQIVSQVTQGVIFVFPGFGEVFLQPFHGLGTLPDRYQQIRPAIGVRKLRENIGEQQ